MEHEPSKEPDARLLVVEDEDPQRAVIGRILRHEGFAVSEAGSAEEAEEFLAAGQYDLILCDWRLPGRSGGELLRRLRDDGSNCGFVIMTAYGSISHAVEAIRQGADDYLTKPFERDALLLAVRRVLRTRQLEQENRRLRQEMTERSRYGEILGRSVAMQQVFRTLDKIASSDATVLITGESGTGKELVARTLHSASPRNSGPFVPLNCAAIPETLIESELFGHEKGAFTGAHRQRAGKFEEAHGGTLFLDEIGSMPLAVQASLLRVLQDRRLTRLGGSGQIEVDVRVVAATNEDLGRLVANGSFRQDLFYRLNVVPVVVPPLRDRREDIPMLISAFLQQAVQHHGLVAPEVPPAVMKELIDHSWPGNVRELSNVVERLALLAESDSINAEDLPPEIRRPIGTGECPFDLPPTGIDWDAMEQGLLEQALRQTGGNRTSAARLLGLGYKAFLYRLEKHGLS